MREVTRNTIGKPWSDFQNVMNFDLACPLVAVSRSRDFQQMNKTELVRKGLQIRQKLQRNALVEPGSDFQNLSLTLT